MKAGHEQCRYAVAGRHRLEEILRSDWLRASDRTIYRIGALRDFGGVRRGDLGGYIEDESCLAHDGHAWVHDVAQVYGHGSVSGDARIRQSLLVKRCFCGTVLWPS